jgi:quercetin dioxygenase-like cupin family protein
MKFIRLLLSPALLVAAWATASQALAAEDIKPSQTITRAGTQAAIKGSAEYSTGNVRVDPLFAANDAAPFSGAYVTFEPGARSAWHIHPTGQRLLVTAGVGRTGEWGGPVEEIKAGDVIWCPPKIKHWHGASPTTSMTHIALTGTLNGKNVEWLEKVSDEQYQGKGVKEHE